MKQSASWAGWLILGSGLLAPGAQAGTALPLPTPFPEIRYQQMTARSPFAIASAVATAPAATPGFASQLYVDGVAHIGQTDFVAIKSRDPDKSAAIFLEVGKSDADGMKVESVQWSAELGRSTVAVIKSGERATLAFDEQTIRSAPATPVQPGGPRRLFPPAVFQQPDAALPDAPRPVSGPFAHPILRRPRPAQ